MFFAKRIFFRNFFSKIFFSGTLFRKFSFHERICFWNFLIFNYFFSKEMLVTNFMRFRRKCLEKQTHIVDFSMKKNLKRIYLASLYLLMSQYTINPLWSYLRKITGRSQGVQRTPPYKNCCLFPSFFISTLFKILHVEKT